MNRFLLLKSTHFRIVQCKPNIDCCYNFNISKLYMFPLLYGLSLVPSAVQVYYMVCILRLFCVQTFMLRYNFRAYVSAIKQNICCPSYLSLKTYILLDPLFISFGHHSFQANFPLYLVHQYPTTDHEPVIALEEGHGRKSMTLFTAADVIPYIVEHSTMYLC